LSLPPSVSLLLRRSPDKDRAEPASPGRAGDPNAATLAWPNYNVTRTDDSRIARAAANTNAPQARLAAQRSRSARRLATIMCARSHAYARRMTSAWSASSSGRLSIPNYVPLASKGKRDRAALRTPRRWRNPARA